MATKKTFTSSIDALLTPTTKSEVTPEPELLSNSFTPIDDDPLISVQFRMPTSLKIQMEHFCTDNRLKQQHLITRAIQQFIQ